MKATITSRHLTESEHTFHSPRDYLRNEGLVWWRADGLVRWGGR